MKIEILYKNLVERDEVLYIGGEENEQKEYIHPRATLVGAPGRHSQTERSLIFITEMVAFFLVFTHSGKEGTKEAYALQFLSLVASQKRM